MSNSPIEFLGEEPGHDVPATEYGGDDGLIQPEQPGVLRGDPAASGGHVLSEDAGERGIVGEKNAVGVRAAMANGSLREQVTGEADDEEIRDPATGRVVPPGAYKNVDGSRRGSASGDLSSLQP